MNMDEMIVREAVVDRKNNKIAMYLENETREKQEGYFQEHQQSVKLMKRVENLSDENDAK